MTEVTERPANRKTRTVDMGTMPGKYPPPMDGTESDTPAGLMSETPEAMLTRLAEVEGASYADDFKAVADDGMTKLVINLTYILEDIGHRLARLENRLGSKWWDEYPMSYALTSDPHRRHWPCWSPGKEADMLCHCHDDTDCACNGLPRHPRGSGLEACGDRP